jgi:hypothetical protein
MMYLKKLDSGLPENKVKPEFPDYKISTNWTR